MQDRDHARSDDPLQEPNGSTRLSMRMLSLIRRKVRVSLRMSSKIGNRRYAHSSALGKQGFRDFPG